MKTNKFRTVWCTAFPFTAVDLVSYHSLPEPNFPVRMTDGVYFLWPAALQLPHHYCKPFMRNFSSVYHVVFGIPVVHQGIYQTRPHKYVAPSKTNGERERDGLANEPTR
eukprot:scaffold2193_cov171-Amphora_coffeaeformis.AAC.21